MSAERRANLQSFSISNIINSGWLPAPTPRPLVSPVDLSSLPDCQYSPATEHELASVYVVCDIKTDLRCNSDAELKLVGEYGLRNKREVWRVGLTLSKIRRAAR